MIVGLLATVTFGQDSNPVVMTEFGPVEGLSIPIHTGDVIDTFLGIPFARAPVAELRFEVSQKHSRASVILLVLLCFSLRKTLNRGKKCFWLTMLGVLAFKRYSGAA